MNGLFFKKKVVLIVVGSILFFGGVYVHYYTTFVKKMDYLPVDQKESLEVQQKEVVLQNVVQNKKQPINNEKETWNPMGTSTDAAEIRNWFAQRGNFSFMGDDQLSDYTVYDDNTLNQLGENGDLRALHVLADRSKNIEDFKNILHKAAVLGSTEALIRMGAINEAEDLDRMKVEDRKEKILDALSYYDAAQLRGDWWGNIVRGESLLKRYSHELSQQDKETVKVNAKKIYDSFQDERNMKGIGDFDNSVPDPVIKFYEEMLRPL